MDVNIKELDVDMIPPITKRKDESDYGGSKIVVIGKPGCFIKGTNILMYDNTTKKVEDIELEDQLMGDDNTPRNVLSLCRNRDVMYEITSLDGTSYCVNANHKLVCYHKYKKTIVEISAKTFSDLSSAYKKDYLLCKSSGCELPISKYDIRIKDEIFYNKGRYYTIKRHNIHDILSMSLKQRYIFIAGVLDSLNGIKLQKTCVFITIPKRYKELITIFRSAGLITYAKDTIINSRDYIDIRLYGNLSKIPANLDLTAYKKDIKPYFVFKIRKLFTMEYYGFTIDKNHRFLLDTYDIVRNTGKSTLIKSLLYAKKHIFPVGMIMSGTEENTGFYSEFVPSTFVYSEYREDKIESLINRQRLAKQHLPNPWAVLLIDDCADSPKLLKKEIQHKLFKMGRHMKLWYILSLQYSMDISPALRACIDGVFILRESNLKNRKNLYENYGGIIPSFDIFCQLMDALTHNYCAMYIHNTTQSNDWQDCVYYYKAPQIKNFKFGAKQIWDFHNERFDSSNKYEF